MTMPDRGKDTEVTPVPVRLESTVLPVPEVPEALVGSAGSDIVMRKRQRGRQVTMTERLSSVRQIQVVSQRLVSLRAHNL